MSISQSAENLEVAMQKLRYVQFEMVMRVEEPMSLPPYKGSTIRGAFGNTFKKMVCVKRDLLCDTCLISDRCVYHYSFETPDPGPSAGQGRTFAPHPFIIEPPLDRRERFTVGDELLVGLTLVGRALEQLPYFIYAFDEMAQNGLGRGRAKARLMEVRVGQGAESQVIYEAGSGKIQAFSADRVGATRPHALPETCDELQMRFETPTRMKSKGRLTDNIGFPLLVRSLLRRISDLARYHCMTELDLDYRGLIADAEEVVPTFKRLTWLDWDRYSSRQKRMMTLGGVVGQIGFAGPLAPFFPLLKLGTDLHVGKATAFGLGKYTITAQGECS